MPHSGTFGLVLTVHVLAGVFIVGPLTLISAVAPHLLRSGPRALPALRACVRLIRMLALGSLIIVVTGAAMVHQGAFGSVRSFRDTWVAGALVLWVVALAVTLGVIAPGLSRAVAEIDAGGNGRRRRSVQGGVLVSTACWVLIIAFMVVKPGA